MALSASVVRWLHHVHANGSYPFKGVKGGCGVVWCGMVWFGVAWYGVWFCCGEVLVVWCLKIFDFFSGVFMNGRLKLFISV